MDVYETTSIASLHSPESHSGAGPLKMIIRKSYWNELVWEFHSSFDSKTAGGVDAGGCVDNSRTIGNFYHCAYRPVTLSWTDPTLPSNHNPGQRSILFQPEKDTGRWVFFVVHYKWDNTGSGGGVLEIWMKRGGESEYTKVVNQRSYVGLITNDSPYLKMGLSAIDGDACPHLQYYDNLKVGDHSSSFAEVDPSIDTDLGGQVCDVAHLSLCGDIVGCEGAGGYWCSGSCQSTECDLSGPPEISLIQPKQVLPHGTDTYTVQIQTNIDADCNYQYSPEISNRVYDYFEMTGVPTSTGSTVHSKRMAAIGKDADFYQYWKCRNRLNSAISSQFAVHIRVAPCQSPNCEDDTTPPTVDEGNSPLLTLFQPTSNLLHGTTAYTVKIQTDINAECRFQYTPKKSYSSFDFYDMLGRPTSTGSRMHTKEMVKIETHADFYQYWKCQASTGEISGQKEVRIKVGTENKQVILPSTPEGNSFNIARFISQLSGVIANKRKAHE